ncbi:MAG: DUF134 domain-containing protein [Proteobacteria bacterium]|nr:DUF134 domain-containing protein [Pseudomonadota bacterium]MBU1389776.1 DUF134 domain-containing protein [Pseudomonadota bacterium]MBU1543785.1 DUF134 domain-containing protein [Pseudomonadota bacterium]MBU2430727.1 DUF134 domain-containing protein [Pseudomonadota bacterium]MBU2479588.1 DUF134 domain-containing protein [Pseudomonadota bacterium]
MPRPKRLRCILGEPSVNKFGPHGFKGRGEITLSLEEFEAIRHIDFEGLDQSQAAQIMDVSRQTFGRILKSGRYNLSNALVNGYHLKIEGGCYTMDTSEQRRQHGHGRGNGRRCGGKGPAGRAGKGWNQQE